MKFPSGYSHPIAIEPGDIDFMGHVNNASSLKWVQAAVLAHWRDGAPPEAVAAHCWIALKHEITYRKPAFLDDDLRADVTLQNVRRESAFYRTLICRGSEMLAEINSRWCCLDATTHRPARLAPSIVAHFFPDENAESTPAG